MTADACLRRGALASLALTAITLAVPIVALAQGEGASFGVVRSTEGAVSAGIADSVDAALLRDLADLAGVDKPTVSPVELREIQLNVGCEGESRACLASVADTLHVGSLVVRDLSLQPDGTLTLRIVRFVSTTANEPAVARATASPETPEALDAEVPRLVRAVFGLPQPAAPVSPAPIAAVPEPLPPPQPTVPDRGARSPGPGGGGIGAITWVTLAAGAAIVTSGLVVALSAQGSYRDFKQTHVETRDDVNRLRADFESAQTRATIANVLIPLGGAVLGVGAALLIIDLTRDGDAARETASLSVIPSANGVMLNLRGRLGGI